MEKLEVIKDNCIACGLCISMTNNEVFDEDDEGKSKVVKQVINDEIVQIANMCPTGAIIITKE